MTLFSFHSSSKAKKQTVHKKKTYRCFRRRTLTIKGWKKDFRNTAQYMLLFYTSNFSFGVEKKRKKCPHV